MNDPWTTQQRNRIAQHLNKMSDERWDRIKDTAAINVNKTKYTLAQGGAAKYLSRPGIGVTPNSRPYELIRLILQEK